MAHRLLNNRLDPRLLKGAGVLCAAVVAGGGGGCLFTDPINMPPDATINKPAAVWRKQPVSFTARTADPNGDVVTLRWAHKKICAAPGDPVGCAACPSDSNAYLDQNLWPEPTVDTPTYAVPLEETDEPFCVWAFAVDSHGALRPAPPLSIDPMNRPPVAHIDVNSEKPGPPYSLFSVLAVSAEGSQDEDDATLTPEWNLSAPLGSQVQEVGDCPPPFAETARCFTPDRDGVYAVELKVDDGHGGTDLTTRDIVVGPDMPPCLALTEPAIGTTRSGYPFDQAAVYTVLRVTDDGDEFPPTSPNNELQFRWFESKVPGPFVYKSASHAAHTVGTTDYRPGDVVKVRVQIRDRNTEAGDRIFLECGDADLCGKPGCYQRVTWTINYR